MKPEPFHVIEGDRVDAEPEQDIAPADNVGAFLREARETTGRSIADVAGSLCIRAKFLQSIEDGRYEDLPGQTYAVGFIRSYADFLGLETATLLEQFKAETSGVNGQPDLDFPEPSTDGWFPTGKVVAGGAIVAVAVFTGWYFLQTDNSVDVATVPSPPGFESVLGAQAANQQPDDAAAPADAGSTEPTEAAAAEPAETQTDTPSVATTDAAASGGEQPIQEPEQVTALATGDPAVTEAEHAQAEFQSQLQPAEAVSEALAPVTPHVTLKAPVNVAAAPAVVIDPLALDENVLTPAVASAVEEPPQPVAKPAVAAPPAPEPATPDLEALVAALPRIPAGDGVAISGDDGRTYGVINQQARVVIGARADSWVQVLDGNQNVLLTRMLRPGDRYLVPNRSDLVMLTGNAGGLIISVDGEQVPRIGSDGAILHNVRLDVELLKAGRAVIE